MKASAAASKKSNRMKNPESLGQGTATPLSTPGLRNLFPFPEGGSLSPGTDESSAESAVQHLHEEERTAALDVLQQLSCTVSLEARDRSRSLVADSTGNSTSTGTSTRTSTRTGGKCGTDGMPPQRTSLRQNRGSRSASAGGSNSSGRSSYHFPQQEGVLWKRRDVFKNQWRPRWFVLNARQGMLTYYLLTNDAPPRGPSRTQTLSDRNVSSRSSSTLAMATLAPPSALPLPPPMQLSPAPNRRRTLSESSTDSVHYDVVPRGTIIVRPRRFVQVSDNDRLSAPQDQLFAFTITLAHPTERCHLAATSAADRAAWVHAIQRVGGGPRNATNDNGVHTANGNGSGRTLERERLESDSSLLESNNFVDSDRTFDSFTNSLDLEPFPLTEHEELQDDSQDDSAMERPSQSQPPQQSPASSQYPSHQHTSNGAQNTLPTQRQNDPQLSADFYRDVPDGIANRTEELINQYLSLCDEHSEGSGDWKQIIRISEQQDENSRTDVPSEHRFSVRAWTRQNPNRPSLQLLKSTAIMPMPPTILTHLLLDCRLRGDLEPNLAKDNTKRVRAYNAHTFLDYYAYLSVWPTSPRDFAVAVHWRVLHLSNAICIVAFSRPEAGAPLRSHVRADLEISMYLLEPTGDSAQYTRATRLLSYDLKGHIPRKLANGVLQQQAAMPGVIYQYLRQPRMKQKFKTTEVSNAAIMRDIAIPMLASMRLDRAIVSENLAQGLDQYYSTHPGSRKSRRTGSSSPSKYNRGRTVKQAGPSQIYLIRSAFVLAIPIMAHEAMRQHNLAYREIVFVLATLFAIRTVVLDHLGPPITRSSKTSVHQQQNSMTCRFTVDLKGVLRYIANAHADRVDIVDSDIPNDLSVTHIVVCAMARAMAPHQAELLARRVQIPWLGIDGYFQKHPSSSTINVGVTTASGQQLTVDRADQCGVADIARIMATQQGSNGASTSNLSVVVPWWSSLLPSLRDTVDCLVLTTPDTNNHCEVDIDVTSTDDDIPVALVLSGVRLAPSSKKSHRPKKHPMLHMSLTVRHAGLPTCRLLAESVQQLVSFPELCDDDPARPFLHNQNQNRS